jgi:glycosyltransferase involved in cell wall biosynthesis
MTAAATNIGFCENGAGYGGAVISLAALLEHMPARYASHIFTSIGTAPYQKLAALGQWRHLAPVALVDPARLRARGVPFASSVDNLVNVLPYALKYYRIFRRQKIDLVYLNNDTSCNLAAALAGKFAGLPLVLHARGFNADTRGSRWVLANLEHCIAVSHAVKDEILALGLDPEKISVVPEGLDLNAFHPRPPALSLRAELGIGEDEPVITLVAGLVDWKGQDILVEASKEILAQFPKAHILLAGGAYGKDDVFANQVTKSAADPAFNGRVRLLGSRGDIPDLLSISTIVLHTSTKPEPFGRTFLEGMALGKAVIASNQGGPLDVITHEVDGLLITPGQPALLAQAVIRLLADPALAARLGAAAAATATGYSIEHHARLVGAVLDKVRDART